MSSNTKNNDTSLWDHYRHVIRSSIGGWKIGEAVYNHGYSMLDELVGNLSYMQVIVLNATGRIPDKQFSELIEAMHICMSWPDPRIWCNQIGALGGSNRTTPLAATTAGILASDARMYGTKPLLEGVKFINDALHMHRSGHSVEEIIDQECAKNAGKPYLMGYARPIAKGDARISAMEKLQNKLDIDVGEHQKLAYSINNILWARFKETMNFCGYLSAVMADHEYTPIDVYRLFSILVCSGVTACYVDAINKPAEAFLSLRCDDIDYQGKAPRKLPSKST